MAESQPRTEQDAALRDGGSSDSSTGEGARHGAVTGSTPGRSAVTTPAELAAVVRGILAEYQDVLSAPDVDRGMAALSELEERCKGAEADGAMDRENARAALDRAEAAERERDEALRGITEASMEWAERILAAEARVRELEEALGGALDVLTWMSGSSDFSPDGQAHEGWVKSQPAVDRAFAALATASGKDDVVIGGSSMQGWPASGKEEG